MVVVPVEQRDAERCVAEHLRGRQPTKAAADDDNRPFHVQLH